MEHVERVDGYKYHLNRLSDGELDAMRAHALARISGAMRDVEIVETEIAARRPEQQLTLEMPIIERTQVAQLDFQQRVADL